MQPNKNVAGAPQGYPPQPYGYPQPGYPPQQQPGYPQYQQPGYPQPNAYQGQQPGYPPQGPGAGYPPQGAAASYPPQPLPVLPHPTSFMGKPMGFDPEAQANMTFANQRVRAGFIRKVFFIISLQLAITITFATACFKTAAIKTYVSQNPWIFWLAWGLSLACILILSFSGRARRTHPYNLIMLFTFTFCEAFLVGMVVSHYESRVVLLAFAVTGCTVFATTLFACQTKWDITSKGGILFILMIVLIVLSIIGIFWVNTIYHLVIAGFGAILFTFYLIHDVQRIMGGRASELSPDEYVFGALTVYIDVVNMFLYILQIMGFIDQQ